MATFVQIGSLAANGTGYFNASNITSILFTANVTVVVSIFNTNTGADVLTITLSSADGTYETHRIIADAFIAASTSGSTYVQLPAQLPGNRTLSFAIG
jgi:hypothetical protein